MNCIEYIEKVFKESKCDFEIVKEKIKEYHETGNSVIKSDIHVGDWCIFVSHFHIGFAKLCNEYNELKTVEMNENELINRTLSLYDDNMDIVLKLDESNKNHVKLCNKLNTILEKGEQYEAN